MNFFSKKKPEIQLIEVPKTLPALDEAGKAALGSLAEHPGLSYLLNRIRLQRAALEGGIKHGQHADLNAVFVLQSGIRWMTWLENQITSAVGRANAQVSRAPNDNELDALQESLSFIEGIGG